MKTVIEQVLTRAIDVPRKIALTDGKQAWTYYELAKAILLARVELRETYGITEGDAVVLAADKQLSFVSTYFACHLLRARVLPLAPDTNMTRLCHICDVCRPRLLIGIATPENFQAQKATLADVQNIKASVAHSKDVVALLEKDESIEWRNIGFPTLDEPADVLFTTGTTAAPKGVELTQRNLAAAVRNINTFIQNTSSDVELLALPVSHSFGLKRMMCALANGQTLVLLGSFANMKRFYRFMEMYHVTGFGMVPSAWAMIRRMSGEKIGTYASQLRYIEIGSAPMPMEEKRELMKLLPQTRICMHYGLTEASRSSFIEFHTDAEHLDTIGKASPNVTITVRDSVGQCVPNDQTGEICVEGDVVARRYLATEDVNRQAFWGKAFRTGDLGVQLPNGYFRLIGREKELINVGGKKVSPVEVEDEVRKLPGVVDCACVPMADPNGILGEVVKAFVVLEAGKELMRDAWNAHLAKRLELYKVPVAYECIDAIPKTTSGKVQRLALR